jgi:predicted GIY-YIG superfamily endonuclease
MRSVYLIRGNDGRYKIGIAKNPKQRIRQLQTGNSDELTLIETYQSENAFKIETALHNRFSHVRQEGEWFDLSITEEVKFVEMCRSIDESITFLKKMDNIFV